MCAPQPKYWLWMMSGAVIRSISSRLLVYSQVGMTPSVSPLCGSVSKSGIGMKGALAGSSQRARPEGGGSTGAAGGAGTGAGSCARAPYAPASNASAQAAAHRPGPLRHGTVAIASARRVPAIGSLDGPVDALAVEVVDDIELDLVLPRIVCPQQQIPGRRGATMLQNVGRRMMVRCCGPACCDQHQLRQHTWPELRLQCINRAPPTGTDGEVAMQSVAVLHPHLLIWREPPVWPFVWRGLLPLAALALTALFAAGPVARNWIEGAVQRETREQLDAAGFGWVGLSVSGQKVTLSGEEPVPGAGGRAIALAKAARCGTWIGRRTCAVSVAGGFTAPAPPASAAAAPPRTAAQACERSLAGVLAGGQIEFASGSAAIEARSGPLLDRL